MQSPNLDPTVGERARPIPPRTLDPTAGERARREHLSPGIGHPVTDPTDPRYAGPATLADRQHAGRAERVVDPTDPQCGLRGD